MWIKLAIYLLIFLQIFKSSKALEVLIGDNSYLWHYIIDSFMRKSKWKFLYQFCWPFHDFFKYSVEIVCNTIVCMIFQYDSGYQTVWNHYWNNGYNLHDILFWQGYKHGAVFKPGLIFSLCFTFLSPKIYCFSHSCFTFWLLIIALRFFCK